MKIRIPIAVSEDGSWEAQGSGWRGRTSKQDERDALQTLTEWAEANQVGPFHFVWVEADVPLPLRPPLVAAASATPMAPKKRRGTP